VLADPVGEKRQAVAVTERLEMAVPSRDLRAIMLR